MPEDPARPALDFVELKVANWPVALDWYVDTLGLAVLLRDDAHGFALLGAGSARVGLKRDPAALAGTKPFRLVFRVDDLDGAAARLRRLGVEVGPPVENRREQYREIRLSDPEGTPITLFQWTQTSERS